MLAGVALLVLFALAGAAAAQPFSDVTAAAGIDHQHGWREPLVSEDGSFDERRHFAGGVAAGDIDGDGWVDLYFVRGDVGPHLLFRNRGDGTFEEVGAAAGVALVAVGPGRFHAGCGPAFADVDGDGRLDLFVGNLLGEPPALFRNRGDGTFADVTAASGLLALTRATYSAAFGDVDGDGDLDLALAHWNSILVPGESSETLWRNDGRGRFTDVSRESGIAAALLAGSELAFDFTFTPNFADLDDDGDLDLLIAADIGSSRVFRNRGDGTFEDRTDRAVISDENGMGAAVGDVDGDGVLDWFVSSIWDPDGFAEGAWGVSGNRLYRGRGDGTFADVTTTAGVREGYWGWAATFADLDNDGHLDLFHVNGFGRSPDYEPSAAFHSDPSRLFLARGDGTFAERAAELGVAGDGMGRGAVAFDYDRDGDLDLLTTSNAGPPHLFRNDAPPPHHFLAVRLEGGGPNSAGVGARVLVEAGGRTQMRELRAGSNYLSQDPIEAHFGLGEAATAERVEVRWPDGARTVRESVAAGQLLRLGPPAACAADCNGDGRVAAAEVLRAVRLAAGAAAPASCPSLDATPGAGAVVAQVFGCGDP